MKRDIEKLADHEYDLVIVGGGIFGACAAWDAALRGLSVALVEKGDFSGATSANHFKMVHGGIRYLQHGDAVRVRESSRERSALLRIAPHLVKPLPIVMPTYGRGMKGKAILGTGMLVYDLLTMDRNRGLHEDRRIPRGGFMSREQVLELFPGIKRNKLTGAAVFCDGQMYNPPRIVLSFIRSAVERGAVAANYVQATGFLKAGNQIFGIKAKDLTANREFDIRGRCVLNAPGPWAHRLLENTINLRMSPRPTFSRDLAMVVNRSNAHGYALAFSTPSKDSDTIVDRGGRHLFAVPWRNYTLIGVWHKLYTEDPDHIAVESQEIQSFVNEVNQAYPGLKIDPEEINLINAGLTLFGDEARQGAQSMSFGKRSILHDHEASDGIRQLITLIGVRATTARGMAAQAVDLVLRKLGKPPAKAATQNIPIYGGGIVSFDQEVRAAVDQYGARLTTDQARHLVANYGSRWADVMQYAGSAKVGGNLGLPGSSEILIAEIRHAVKEEMAVYLSDAVLRRTDLGSGRMPANPALKACAELMAQEMGWDQEKMENEMESIGNDLFPAAFFSN